MAAPGLTQQIVLQGENAAAYLPIVQQSLRYRLSQEWKRSPHLSTQHILPAD
jgi:hypothetical protein